MSKISPLGEHFIVAPSLHKRSLPNSESGDLGQTAKGWLREKGPISTCILLVNSTGIILPPTPIISLQAPGTMDPLYGGWVIKDEVAPVSTS